MAVIHMYYIYMGKMMSIYSLVVYNATQYNVRSIYAPNHAFAKKKYLGIHHPQKGSSEK